MCCRHKERLYGGLHCLWTSHLVLTIALAALFFGFDRAGGTPSAWWLSALLALLWALAPLIAALIVRRVDPKTRYP